MPRAKFVVEWNMTALPSLKFRYICSENKSDNLIVIKKVQSISSSSSSLTSASSLQSQRGQVPVTVLIYTARLITNDVGPGIGACRRVCIPGRVGKSIVSGCMKASSTRSSETLILSSTFDPSTPTGPEGVPTGGKPRRHKIPVYHLNNCAVIERRESSVDFPCLSFHSFRLLLLFIQDFEKPENAHIERLRDVGPVCNQSDEYGRVHPAKGLDLGSHMRRVLIDNKDHAPFVSKFLTKLIDSRKEHRFKSINNQCFSD
jgi:hypothetical protein